MNDDRGWRLFATATMLLLFFGLLVLVALFDAFLSRFLPVFLGLMSVALVAYALVALIVRTILRARHAARTDDTDTAP